MKAKDIADGTVLFSLLQCVREPTRLFANGQLNPEGSFIAVVIIFAAVLFVEFYFRDPVDAV